MPSFYEFFAGGGMARAGLGDSWQCLFANDIDEKKAESYTANWGNDHLVVGDVNHVTTEQLPGKTDLAWASFPCQDLSLAGNGRGLEGERSGAFWPFWQLMERLANEDRSPRLIMLENVIGALSSKDSKGFTAIGDALVRTGYDFGAVVVDAERFLPQSRPRLFIIGVQRGLEVPGYLTTAAPIEPWHPRSLQLAHSRLSKNAQEHWIWWSLPIQSVRRQNLEDIVEDPPTGVEWHSPELTARLVEMMTPVNRAKVDLVRRAKRRTVGTIYRRTRNGEQRAEVRFDQVAGCLRTPTGGSSRQTLIIIEGDSIRSRLLSPREAARLMGLPDDYQLPDNYNAAYHLAGDGVAVPVVRHLAAHILEPILAANAEAFPQHQIKEAQPVYG